MSVSSSSDNEFIVQLTEITEANLTNPRFGVSMLASEMGMSRSNLHRKVDAGLKISVSQFVNQVRLKKAKDLLRHTSETVSEVAYNVGFSNVSYFIKCFHEYYGYPPGEVGQRNMDKETSVLQNQNNSKRFGVIIISAILTITLGIIFFYIFNPLSTNSKNLEKSIAVLPPTYIGSDSTYIHQINGTISMVLDYLSIIRGMKKVTPWTTVQKYKNKNMSAEDISRELGVSYIVESNGMAMKDFIRLNIKLIDGKRNNQIGYYPYDVQTKELIKLSQKIAIYIAGKIDARISLEEKGRIEKMPTENIAAWDHFLNGKELFTSGLNEYYGQGDEKNEGSDKVKGIYYLTEAINFFEKAVKNDNNFGLAYAYISIGYFLIDIGDNEGKYASNISENADLAQLYDPGTDLSNISKAYDYVQKSNYNMAVSYLEKAIQYNPTSTLSYRLLADLYNLSIKDTEKHLEYKLLAVKLGEGESYIQKSEDYRLAARALRAAGFYAEANIYINRSIELNRENRSSIGEKAEIIIESYHDYLKARELLNEVLNYDPQNVEILRFLFTNHYLSKEYEDALFYYKKIIEIDPKLSFLAITDYSRLAVLFYKLNMYSEFQNNLEKFKNFERSHKSAYVKDLHMIRLCCLENDIQGALTHFNKFGSHQYHVSNNIRMLRDDPVFEALQSEPVFQKVLSEIESKFWENHKQIRTTLEDKGLL